MKEHLNYNYLDLLNVERRLIKHNSIFFIVTSFRGIIFDNFPNYIISKFLKNIIWFLQI